MTVYVPVPVEERLPTQNGIYTVIYFNGFIGNAEFFMGRWDFHEPSGIGRRLPTHWMEAKEMPSTWLIAHEGGSRFHSEHEREAFDKGAQYIIDHLKGKK